jgi:hypothetical protein
MIIRMLDLPEKWFHVSLSQGEYLYKRLLSLSYRLFSHDIYLKIDLAVMRVCLLLQTQLYLSKYCPPLYSSSSSFSFWMFYAEFLYYYYVYFNFINYCSTFAMSDFNLSSDYWLDAFRVYIYLYFYFIFYYIYLNDANSCS